MKFIVTGTPRSATRYAAVLFSLLEVPCRHEEVCRPNADLICLHEWQTGPQQGESSWLAWAFLGAMAEPVVVFHSRRDPFKVIDSLAHRNQMCRLDRPETAHNRRQQQVIEWYCPRIRHYTESVDRAAVMLLDWNRRIVEAATRYAGRYVPYLVERVDSVEVSVWLDAIGCERSVEQIDRALDAVAKDTNCGRKVRRGCPISNQQVWDYIVNEIADGRRIATAVVEPATEFATRAEILDRMAPELAAEVVDYAERFGYVEPAVCTKP